jgi:hypothetical protein
LIQVHPRVRHRLRSLLELLQALGVPLQADVASLHVHPASSEHIPWLVALPQG